MFYIINNNFTMMIISKSIVLHLSLRFNLYIITSINVVLMFMKIINVRII